MCFIKAVPENHGISSQSILNFINETEASSEMNLTNFILLHDHSILAQFCKKPYDANDMQLLYSITKAVTSLGIGIAADKGYFDLDDKVIAFFPKKLPESISENLSNITIRHLLTMTSGIHENTYGALYPQKDWVAAFLAQEFSHEPGTYFRYSSHASHMLSAIIEIVTGQNLLDFLDIHLFSPLDIPKLQWETGPDGIIAGGMGLSLAPVSVTKIGYLLLNNGEFFGKRIISSDYVDLATSAQATKQDELNDPDKKYSGYQFGYQFPIGTDGCFRADGAFGQQCLISPEKNFVIVATSRNINREKFLSLIYKYFIQNPDSDANDAAAYAKLQSKLTSMEYAVPKFCKIPQGTPALNNNGYTIDENPNGVHKIILNQNENILELAVIYCDGVISELQFDFAQPVYGRSVFVKDIQMHLQKYISYAKWISNSALELTVIYLETPYVVTYDLAFSENKIAFKFTMNVSLNLGNFTATGHLISHE